MHRLRKYLELFLSETSLQTALLFSAQILSTLLNAATSVFAARWLGSAEFGLYLFCSVSVIQFSGYFFEFGTAAAAARLLAVESNSRIRNQLLGAMIVVALLLGAMLAGIIVLVSPAIDAVFNTQVQWVLKKNALLCLFVPLQFFLEQACQGLNRINELALLRIAVPAMSLVAMVITMILCRFEATSALCAALTGVAAGCAFVTLLLKPSFFGLSSGLRQILAETRRFGLDIYFGRVTTMVSTKLDTLIIPGLLGARLFGFYSIAQKFAEPMSNLSRSMAMTRFRTFARDGWVSPLILKINLLLLVCATVALVTVGPYLLILFYSAEYKPAAELLLPFAMGAFFAGLYQPYNAFLSAQGRGSELRNISFLMGTINCISLFYIIPRYGLSGGAWMVAVASALNFSAHYYYYWLCVNMKLRITLVDLSTDPKAALDYVCYSYSGYELETIPKDELRVGSKLQWLVKLNRSGGRRIFLIFCDRLEWQTRRSPMLIFGLLTGAREALLVDSHGKVVRRTWFTAVTIELPHLLFELVGSFVVVALSWILTVLLELLVKLRPFRSKKRANDRKSFVFIRTTPTSGAQTGGANSHITGFTSGALAEGYSVRFISNDAISGIDRQKTPIEVIPPSPLFNAHRMIFELWNNLVFTLQAYGKVKQLQPAFIYQRYSRFSWAGVAISRLTGIPLLLEYNGSEVWIGRYWDQVSLIWLLKRFERLNLAAAQIIFVVSDVERRNLIAAGVDTARVIVNPNGVDPQLFRPGCGGEAVRQRLGLADKVVVGFVGTFGPWHGVLVIAEALKLLGDVYHFLLIGEGSLKARLEQLVNSAGLSHAVTFTGRLSHKHVPAYLDACDILISPHVPMEDGSEFFGSPTKLFEYMAMGKAIVASSLGQIADIIEDGKSGLLITPGSATELAEKIRILAQDRRLRESLGSEARKEVCSRYTWRDNAARVLTAFEMMFGDSCDRYKPLLDEGCKLSSN